MKIIGYIRCGDKTACGGEVVEGIDHTNSYVDLLLFAARAFLPQLRDRRRVAKRFRLRQSVGYSRHGHHGGCPHIHPERY